MNSFASGTAGIIKNGAGTLTIGGTAPNTYNGTTRLNAGILSLARDSALGTGLLDIGGNGTIQATSSDTRIVTNPVKFTSSAFSIGGSGALSFSGDADVGTGTTTVTVNNTAVTTFSGALTNTGGLVKEGPGALVLSGANTYAGGTALCRPAAPQALVQSLLGQRLAWRGPARSPERSR